MSWTKTPENFGVLPIEVWDLREFLVLFSGSVHELCDLKKCQVLAIEGEGEIWNKEISGFFL